MDEADGLFFANEDRDDFGETEAKESQSSELHPKIFALAHSSGGWLFFSGREISSSSSSLSSVNIGFAICLFVSWGLRRFEWLARIGSSSSSSRSVPFITVSAMTLEVMNDEAKGLICYQKRKQRNRKGGRSVQVL